MNLDSIKAQWPTYARYVGALLIAASLVLTWFQWTWTALSTLLVVGVIDIALVVVKQDTISQWVHRLFPKAIDFVMVILIGVFTWLVWGAAGFLPVLMGIIIGHLFWHD